MEVSREEMKHVMGGVTYSMVPSPYTIFRPVINPRPLVPFFNVPSGGEEAKKCGCMGMPQDPAECMMQPE